jgi:hypothetical protein
MKKFIFILSIVFFISACKKEDQPTPDPPLTISAFSQLAIGNWWTYSANKLNPSGDYVGVLGSGRDTISINRDTIINGNTFYIAEGTYQGGLVYMREYWRDSANCLVNENGDILFCFGYFNAVFRHDSVPGQYTSDYIVDMNRNATYTAIGVLPCYVMNVTYNYVAFGRKDWHYKYTYYIGRVKWRVDDPNLPDPYEQRLESYHVQ